MQLFICETPGIWGQLPEGFSHIWESKPSVYITPNITSDKLLNFEFKAGKLNDTFICVKRLRDDDFNRECCKASV
jgi:hypothetical protein